MRASPLAHTSRSRRDHTQHDRPRRAAPPHLASPPPSPLSAALLLCDDASSAAMLPSSAASSTLRSALNRARRPNQCCFVATIAVVLLLCTILLSRSGPGNGAAVGVGERLGAFRGLQLQTAPGGGDSGEGAAAAALLLLKRQSDELDQLRRKVAQLEDKRGSAPAAAAAAASATCGPEQVDTIAYMAEHGVLTNSVAQRIKPVPFTSVQFLDKFVSGAGKRRGSQLRRWARALVSVCSVVLCALCAGVIGQFDCGHGQHADRWHCQSRIPGFRAQLDLFRTTTKLEKLSAGSGGRSIGDEAARAGIWRTRHLSGHAAQRSQACCVRRS